MIASSDLWTCGSENKADETRFKKDNLYWFSFAVFLDGRCLDAMEEDWAEKADEDPLTTPLPSCSPIVVSGEGFFFENPSPGRRGEGKGNDPLIPRHTLCN